MENQKSKIPSLMGATVLGPFFTQTLQIFSVFLKEVKTLQEVLKIMAPESKKYYDSINNLSKAMNEHFNALMKLALEYSKEVTKNS